MGRRPQPLRGDGDAAAAGGADAAAAVGARGRRLHRAPVRRKAPADDRGAERRRTRDAGVHPPPLRPRAAQRRRAACGGLHQGHAQPAGRRDRPRCGRQPDRPAARPAQRDDPIRDPREGAEASAGLPEELHAPFHARAEPARRDQRDRRRWRLPELSGRLCHHRGAARRRRVDACASATTSSRRSRRRSWPTSRAG